MADQEQKRGEGEARLRAAWRKFVGQWATERGPGSLRFVKENSPPLDTGPTTPFEQAILYRYEELQRNYEDLKKRVDWLTLAIVGAALTFILETLFS
jgi:hypothetical protein